MSPIYRRPLDLALFAFFSVSVLYGFLFNVPQVLDSGAVARVSPNFF